MVKLLHLSLEIMAHFCCKNVLSNQTVCGPELTTRKIYKQQKDVRPWSQFWTWSTLKWSQKKAYSLFKNQKISNKNNYKTLNGRRRNFQIEIVLVLRKCARPPARSLCTRNDRILSLSNGRLVNDNTVKSIYTLKSSLKRND